MTQSTAAKAQAARKRFSFGPVWSAAVIAGQVKDHEKLIAHGIKLKVGSRSELKKVKFETLLGKVGAALQSDKGGKAAAAE